MIEKQDIRWNGSAAFDRLKQELETVLETYSNVHRGSGHFSQTTTQNLDEAREIVLDYLGLDKGKFVVIFCNPRREKILKGILKPGTWQFLSDSETGLHLGISALAVNRKDLPPGIPFQTGGGTARLISRDWVIWAHAPEKFEAGTPSIINSIVFARALQLLKYSGPELFRVQSRVNPETDDLLKKEEFRDLSGLELLNELRKTMYGRNIQVNIAEKRRAFINLDYAASTPAFRPVSEVFFRVLEQEGLENQAISNEVKSICAEVLGAPLSDYDVIFTSNTTESINLVAENLCRDSNPGTDSVIVNTLLEHNSNELPWRLIPESTTIRLQVDNEGFININELESLISDYNQKGRYGRKRIKIVAVTGASNVLGTCNDLQLIGEVVHRYGAQLLVDAAQLVAHRKIETEKWGIDYLVFSAHKVYAPFGTGVLIARKGLLSFNSEDMKLIHTSGGENAGGIAALGKALLLLQKIGPDLIEKEEEILTARILRGMAQIPGIRIYGINDPDSPLLTKRTGVIGFSLKNLYADKAARLIAANGIGLRSGCHCAHLLVKKLVNIPPFLEQIQRLILLLLPNMALPGILRISLGIGTTTDDVDTFIDVLATIAGDGKAGSKK